MNPGPRRTRDASLQTVRLLKRHPFSDDADEGLGRPDRPGLGPVERALLGAIGDGPAALCLCDERDDIVYCNPAFRRAFFGDVPELPANFMDAIVKAMRLGRGIKLESMSIEEFAPRVKERRRQAQEPYRFTVDLQDGTWWQVTDHKTPEGWILAVASEVTQLKRDEFALRSAHAEATRAAQTDYLTGLPNRRHGFEQGARAIERHRESGALLAVSLLDIDHFKGINDTYGHETGDKVLAHIAAFMRAIIGPSDQLSRVGGEEFMLILPDTTAEAAQTLVRRLVARIPPLGFPTGQRLKLAASAGLAFAHPRESLDEVISRADAALYAAKAGGRRRLHLSPTPTVLTGSTSCVA